MHQHASACISRTIFYASTVYYISFTQKEEIVSPGIVVYASTLQYNSYTQKEEIVSPGTVVYASTVYYNSYTQKEEIVSPGTVVYAATPVTHQHLLRIIICYASTSVTQQHTHIPRIKVCFQGGPGRETPGAGPKVRPPCAQRMNGKK